MREKKYKYVEDLLEDYLELHDEQIETPLLIEKVDRKIALNVSEDSDTIYKTRDAESLFKAFNQLKKHHERRIELVEEIAEVESQLKDFLLILKSGKVSYEKKDDNDKTKTTYLFWLEDGLIKCNR